LVTGAVTEVTFGVLDAARPTGFIRSDLKERVFRSRIPDDGVKDMEFGFGAEEGSITNAGAL
jgi:hypothetical protein